MAIPFRFRQHRPSLVVVAVLVLAALVTSLSAAFGPAAQAAGTDWPGTRQTVAGGINDAENLVFTPSGRLFVSGDKDVWEVTRRPDGSYAKTQVFSGNSQGCTVEGIVLRGDYLYGVCWKLVAAGRLIDSYLIGGAVTGQPQLGVIGNLPSGGVYNDLAVGPGNDLYSTDSIKGTIDRFTLSGPLSLTGVSTWSTGNYFFVNGIQQVGGYMYFTSLDAGSLHAWFGRFPVQPDGSAGTAQILYTRLGTDLDDFTYHNGLFQVTDYLGGSVVELKVSGTKASVVRETPKGTFWAPTNVLWGQGPMFSPSDLLVTEKGVIFVAGDGVGDRLSVWH